MTPEQKEHWRWTFAGQFAAAPDSLYEHTEYEWRFIYCGYDEAIQRADSLIAELTKKEQEECEHKVFMPAGAPPPISNECPKCGKKFETCEHKFEPIVTGAKQQYCVYCRVQK